MADIPLYSDILILVALGSASMEFETYVRRLRDEIVRVSQIPPRKLLDSKRDTANDRYATKLTDLHWV